MCLCPEPVGFLLCDSGCLLWCEELLGDYVIVLCRCCLLLWRRGGWVVPGLSQIDLELVVSVL